MMNKLSKSKIKRILGLFLALIMFIGTEETAIIVNAASVLYEELADNVFSAPDAQINFTQKTLNASDATGVEIVSEQTMKEITGEVYPVIDNDGDTLNETEEFTNNTITENNKNFSSDTISENSISTDTISENDIINKTEKAFSLCIGKIMYGEDGSNTYGNLDRIFCPSWNYNGTLLAPPGTTDSLADYYVSYKFSLDNIDNEMLNTWTSEDFHNFESIKLESLDAGTTVNVIAMAQLKEDTAIVAFTTATFTISKREVYIKLNSDSNICIDMKEVAEDGIFTVPVSSEYDYITISTVSDNDTVTNNDSVYALSADTLEPETAVTGSVLIDVTGLNTNIEGYQEVPVSMTFTENFDKNYIVLGNIWGEVYTKKAHYYMTFSGKSNGDSKSITVEVTSHTDKTVREILMETGEYTNVFPSLGGLFNEERNESIASWQVRLDGNSESEYNEDYDYNWSSEQIQNYIINDDGTKHDYFFVAKSMKYAADGLYITSIPEVYYDGRSHLVCDSFVSTKDKVSDIDLHVYSTADDYELRFGTDYTVSYKNNKNATMKLDNEGRYVSIITDETKRPTLIIKGKGRYKGFSVEAYFDILPRNLGQYEYGEYSSSYQAIISGIKYSYALVNGKIKGKITPKVTKEYYSSSGSNRTDRLKEGTDYIAKLYRWNEKNSYWEEQPTNNPNSINKSGDYLYTIWGIGNYCGAVYGQGPVNEFDDGKDSGTPNPTHLEHSDTYSSGSYQFYVSDGDAYWDIANAIVSISKPKIKYNGKENTAKDFGLKVVIKSNGETRTLTEGIDYRLELTDYRVYTYQQNGTTWVGHKYFTATTNDVNNPAAIKVANKYSIRIIAIGDNFYGYKDISKKLCISGIPLKKSYFKISQKNVNFNTKHLSINWYITRAAQRAGLSSSYLGAYTPSCNAAPGKYHLTLYAKYDGVDHDVSKEPTLYWNRKKMDLKTAVKNKYISFSASVGDYKTKGAHPENITVGYQTYKSGSQTINIDYIGQSSTISIPVGNPGNVHNSNVPLTLTFTASKNNKVGDGAKLTIKASGLYSGSYTIPYSIMVSEISDETIPVVTPETYLIENNKLTSYIRSGTLAEGGYIYDGTVVAKIIDGNLSKGASIDKPQIELYQAYYKNRTDYYNDKLSLARIKNTYFKAVADSENGNTTRIKINNSGHSYFSGIQYGDNVYVGSNYSVYEQAVTVIGATLTYNGVEYNFNKNSKITLPFEGRQIRFDRNNGNEITSITIQLPDKNKTQITLDKNHFTVFHGVNTSAGTNTGNFTIILNRNIFDGTYKYGGSKQFNFSISDSDKIIL